MISGEFRTKPVDRTYLLDWTQEPLHVDIYVNEFFEESHLLDIGERVLALENGVEDVPAVKRYFD